MRIALLYETKPPFTRPEVSDLYLEMENIESIQSLSLLLEQDGHQVHLVHMLDEPLARLNRIANKLDVVFNYSVGFGSRSREILPAALCELLGLAYTGSDPMALAIASNKVAAKLIASLADIKTPRFMLFPSNDFLDRFGSHFNGIPNIILKPAFEGSSIGLVGPVPSAHVDDVVNSAEHLAAHHSQPILVEEFISGYELTVPVVDTGDPHALPPVTLTVDGELLDCNAVFGSSVKQNTESVQWIAGQSVFGDLTQIMRMTALQMHRLLGCRDLARYDFRLSPEGELYFLEANPTPQLTVEGGTFAVAAETEGKTLLLLLNDMLAHAITRTR